MAIRFCESFDHYTSSTTGFDQKWGAGNHNGAPTPTTGGGRFGKGVGPWTLNGYFGKDLDAQPTWIVGFAFKIDSTIAGESPVFALYDGGISGTLQCDLRVDSARRLLVTRGGTQLGSTGATVLTAGVWYYVEFKATIHNSAGVVAVRINEVTEISLTGQDTQVTGNATADFLRFYGGANNGSVYTDDIVMLDGTGGSPGNDFLGDVRVEALLPDGNGNSSQLVGSDGNSTDNYLLVDEATPNDDTDYVESSNVGDKDTYAFANLTPTSGTVFGVQPVPYARKTDAGTRKICSVARLSGTEVDSADKVLATTYQYLPDVRETKPGGGAWSIADVNNAEFGVKVTA